MNDTTTVHTMLDDVGRENRGPFNIDLLHPTRYSKGSNMLRTMLDVVAEEDQPCPTTPKFIQLTKCSNYYNNNNNNKFYYQRFQNVKW